MAKQLLIYFKNAKSCIILYLLPCIIVFVLQINGTKSAMNSNISINKFDLLRTIIFKNSLCFLWILLGSMVGGLILKSFLVVNGLVMGLIISKLKDFSQLLLILPHGVLEIAAFIFTCSIVSQVIKEEKFIKYDKIYLLIAYFILIIAAFIEAYFTTSLIKFL